MRGFFGGLVSGLCFAFVLFGSPAHAADTTEVWAAGELEFDLMLSHQGAGRTFGERGLATTLLAGYGITDRISVYGGMVVEADETLSDGDIWPYLGLMAALRDGDHVDVDLLFEVGTSTVRPGELELGPGIELNLDLSPDQGSVGFFTMIGLPLGWVVDDGGSLMAAPELGLDLTVGAYLTVADGHQLFVANNTLVKLRGGHRAAAEETSTVLGYNVRLTDALEWVNQVGIHGAAEQSWRPGLLFETGFLLVIDTSA